MQIDCYGFEATSQFFKRKELDAPALRLKPNDVVLRPLVHRCRGAALELRHQLVPLVEHDHLHVSTSIVSVAGT